MYYSVQIAVGIGYCVQMNSGVISMCDSETAPVYFQRSGRLRSEICLNPSVPEM